MMPLKMPIVVIVDPGDQVTLFEGHVSYQPPKKKKQAQAQRTKGNQDRRQNQQAKGNPDVLTKIKNMLQT